MASSSSTHHQSSFENQNNVGGTNTTTTISQEEFFSFHNIDRQLFSRLVFSLRLEPMEAMHAIAFWLWLERLNMAQYVATIVKLRDDVFRVVFEETILCLRVVESDKFSHPNGVGVPVVQRIVGKDREGVALRFFHDNRISILLGIGHFVEKVCLRAFQDLIQIVLACKPNNGGAPSVGVIGGFRSASQPPPLSTNYEGNTRGATKDLVNYPSSLKVGNVSVPLSGDKIINLDSLFQGGGIGPSNYGHAIPFNSVINNTNYSLETQPQITQGDLVDQLFAQLQLSESSQIRNFEDMPNLVPSEERTIFLTFSKGYPILENELREFFNRTFGDIIETLHMQEVGEKEQPLYARLVVRDARAMEIVLSDQGRSKFSINGKHVWARKYVRKNPHSPPSSPPHDKAN